MEIKLFRHDGQRSEKTEGAGRRESTVKADCGRTSLGYPRTEGPTLKKILKPRAKRQAVTHARDSLGLNQSKACQLVNLSTSVYRYQPKEADDTALHWRLRELAGQRKRFGSPRLHIMLKRENLVVNSKRTERICREEGLSPRRKRRRKGAAGLRVVMPSPQAPNQRWSVDFVTDSIVTGRRFCTLAIIDDYSRECPVIGGLLARWRQSSHGKAGRNTRSSSSDHHG